MLIDILGLTGLALLALLTLLPQPLFLLPGLTFLPFLPRLLGQDERNQQHEHSQACQ